MSAPHKFKYKLAAFDLDGTLAESKGVVPKSIGSLLKELSTLTKVVIISGGSFKQFEIQLLVSLPPSENIILLPAEGTEKFEYRKDKWVMTKKSAFPEDAKEKVMKVLEEIIFSGDYQIPTEHSGPYIEDRDTEIAFSALGQDAPLDKKEAWDPERKKRMKIKEVIEAKVRGVVATIAGTTSIDILPKGVDKAKALLALADELHIAKNEIIFVGDAIVPGANDYSVKEAGIESISVSGPDATERILREWVEKDGKEEKVEKKEEVKDEKEEVKEKKADSTLPIFPKNPVAYFCSEYAFGPDSSMYAGGLGILAGDYVLEAADENTPFIAIGLRYGEASPEGYALIEQTVDIPVGKENIQARVWHKTLSSNVHVFLLDSGKITAHLYDVDSHIRAEQQMILGVGGARLLWKLGISPSIYHLNEGHTAFAGIAIMLEKKEDLGKIVATKHTILSAAGMLINLADLDLLIGPYCKENGTTTKAVFKKGQFESNTDFFSTTKLIMVLSVRQNGVSDIHVVFEKKRHPHSTLISVTNGVYEKRWQAHELLNRPKTMSDEELWKIKRKLRIELFSYIEKQSGKKLNPDICTLVWARRFAAYKRPWLLFSDLERLNEILSNQDTPLQCVISGKAHQSDREGSEIVEKIIAFSANPLVKGRTIYLPDYNMVTAEKLTRGADIWLNTPERGMEACGTSGMKASLNGALQCSISDGWVDEVSWGGRGWILPEENTANVLYDLLDNEILPSFYAETAENPKHEWVGRMRSTIELVEKSYTAGRMLRDYREKLYIPSTKI